MKLFQGLVLLQGRLAEQGKWVTVLWAADHIVRVLTGAPLRCVSQITPHLHVGGQYRRRGWPKLASRGITAVVNARIEFDDNDAGIAPPGYLHLPIVDNDAPTLDQLRAGAGFIAGQVAEGGVVYVHCGSGTGRAPTLAAAYLISTGMSPEQAWTCIRDARPFIRPTPVQVEQIERSAALV